MPTCKLAKFCLTFCQRSVNRETFSVTFQWDEELSQKERKYNRFITLRWQRFFTGKVTFPLPMTTDTDESLRLARTNTITRTAWERRELTKDSFLPTLEKRQRRAAAKGWNFSLFVSRLLADTCKRYQSEKLTAKSHSLKFSFFTPEKHKVEHSRDAKTQSFWN